MCRRRKYHLPPWKSTQSARIEGMDHRTSPRAPAPARPLERYYQQSLTHPIGHKIYRHSATTRTHPQINDRTHRGHPASPLTKVLRALEPICPKPLALVRVRQQQLVCHKPQPKPPKSSRRASRQAKPTHAIMPHQRTHPLSQCPRNRRRSSRGGNLSQVMD
jgi:hypothetical protein